MPLATLKAIWPRALAPGARKWVGERVMRGRVEGGSFRWLAGRYLERQEVSPLVPEQRLSVAIEAADVAMRPLRSMSPIEAPRALIRLEGGAVEEVGAAVELVVLAVDDVVALAVLAVVAPPLTVVAPPLTVVAPPLAVVAVLEAPVAPDSTDDAEVSTVPGTVVAAAAWLPLTVVEVVAPPVVDGPDSASRL